MAYYLFKRKVVDLLVVMGDVGGLKEFFLLFGSLLVNYITSRKFMSRIIKKVYQMRNYANIEVEAKRKSDMQA